MTSLQRTLATVLALAIWALALAVPTQVGPYRVDVTTDPSPVPVGRANLVLKVADAAGKPAPGLKIGALARMPGMNMGEREEVAREGETPGVYTAPAIFSMAGVYQVTVTIDGKQGVVELRTGQATGAGAAGNWTTKAFWGIAILAAVAYVWYRIRKTGQRVDVASILNRQVAGALIVLAAALALAVWAVNTQRRPGSMTPIESQAMEMNTPAPPGVLTVDLATVEERPLVATVAYTGQAVGFVEQDVVPRVAGAIQWMGVYVGDRVAKGQLLARLDPSLLDPEVAMRSAAVGRARRGVDVAGLEYQGNLGEALQARAEAGRARGELGEAEAMLEAAEQGRVAAEADLQAAEAEVAVAGAELASAEAESVYMLAEYDRTRQLFESGAVSKDEIQRAKADSAKAQAMVAETRGRIRRASAMVDSARANLRRAEAEIIAAKRKVQQTISAVKAKDAMVGSAESVARAAKARVGQERAMVQESAAGLWGAATQRGYAQLRAETDGMVTQRLISPGQVALPGQPILRIAQVSPIRLQANVPESDLARLRPGGNVRVRVRGSSSAPIVARIASVAPSVTPADRTGVVEAIYPNVEGAIRPGQFVSMEFEMGSATAGPAVPAAAIQIKSVTSKGILATGERTFVWVAEPEPSGRYALRRQEVRIAVRAREFVGIAEGLKAGQKVVVSPSPDLQEGRLVVPHEGDADSNPTVIVTESGYDPPSVAIPANTAATITFIRKTDLSCTEELVFPELGIKRKLPINEPVRIDVAARAAGELKFACGMDMFQGKVVVR